MVSMSLLTEFAPVATAVSSLVAVITLVVGFKRYNRELAEKKAKMLREDLGSFLSEWLELHEAIKSGYPLIVGATTTVRELQKRYPATTTLDSILTELSNESSNALSIAITAWAETPATAFVSSQMAAVSLRSQRLQGGLALFNPLTRLLDWLVKDGYSPLIFRKVLSLGDGLKQGLSADVGKPLGEAANALVCRLQSEVSVYFVARYGKAIEELRRFAEIGVQAFTALSDKELTSIAVQSEKVHEAAATLPGDIRRRMRDIAPLLPEGYANRLETVLENIETYISKDFALEQWSTRFDKKKKGE
ncbi:MAG: hypothetical protein B7Z37_03420 [Verrucomicrobia bacterium 12-59-8]|nr:MAG: hypothetical protein B7Z37_03420 [Verrucomicrobia bacterium 12-59-8]